MSDIPTELYQEILTRLPVEPLLRFRCVCKQWRDIIDSPHFIKSHLNYHMEAQDMLMIRCISCTGTLYSLSLSSLNHSDSECSKTIEALRIRNVIFKGMAMNFDLAAPPCHGLTLVTHAKTRALELRNPFTGHWLDLMPTFEHFGTKRRENFQAGLGYDNATSDYKVVRVSNVHGDYSTGPHHLKTLIYSSKTNLWHRIDDLPNYHINDSRNSGLYFNGALHWTVDEGNRKCIVSLDLSTETYDKLPLPSDASKASDYNLDAVPGGLILICYYAGLGVFDVWIMKDCGGHNRWTKIVTFVDPAPDEKHRPFKIKGVAYLKNREKLVLQYCNKEFLWFDLVKRTAKNVSIEGMGSTLRGRSLMSLVFPASLIRLDGMVPEVANADNVSNFKKEFQTSCFFLMHCWFY